ncbi:UNVERIFIED_CONTAM: amino acid ABC transporter substrate-binding protein, partial [Salmonella enterica subsp. enterica serovar Weltevreden]
IYATIQAEEYGISQKNLDQFLKSEVPEIRRFLGLEGTLGQDLGLPRDFVVRVIRAVGNYGEIYDRFFGPKSPFHIPRTGTLNA